MGFDEWYSPEVDDDIFEMSTGMEIAEYAFRAGQRDVNEELLEALRSTVPTLRCLMEGDKPHPSLFESQMIDIQEAIAKADKLK